ncbi:unnamed protein product [Dibothriocephalus latus]|uniref:Uncharacterized protein n=1 Tax=Dibothriocephalus latus TaxID=60516 RepID=A0A3P7LMB3_DIBLA|nr:unnamed protein product [Dibothriocephalus latus]
MQMDQEVTTVMGIGSGTPTNSARENTFPGTSVAEASYNLQAAEAQLAASPFEPELRYQQADANASEVPSASSQHLRPTPEPTPPQYFTSVPGRSQPLSSPHTPNRPQRVGSSLEPSTTHLDDVIAHVVSDAVAYANQPGDTGPAMSPRQRQLQPPGSYVSSQMSDSPSPFQQHCTSPGIQQVGSQHRAVMYANAPVMRPSPSPVDSQHPEYVGSPYDHHQQQQQLQPQNVEMNSGMFGTHNSEVPLNSTIFPPEMPSPSPHPPRPPYGSQTAVYNYVPQSPYTSQSGGESTPSSHEVLMEIICSSMYSPSRLLTPTTTKVAAIIPLPFRCSLQPVTAICGTLQQQQQQPCRLTSPLPDENHLPCMYTVYPPRSHLAPSSLLTPST